MPRDKKAKSHRRHALAPLAAAAAAKKAQLALKASKPKPTTSEVASARPKTLQPASKSALKRAKQKRQQIAGGLASISAALEDVQAVPVDVDEGKIGEGRGHGPREKQRRKLLSSNAARIPAVMAHPAFKANPWATIREHAGNSLAVAPEVEAVAQRKKLAETQQATREIVRLRGSDGSGMEIE